MVLENEERTKAIEQGAAAAIRNRGRTPHQIRMDGIFDRAAQAIAAKEAHIARRSVRGPSA